MKTTTKPRRRRATRRQAKLTPSAERYAKAEEAWQEHLRRAKTPAPIAIKRAGTARLLVHKASPAERDAMVRKGICMVDGSHPITNAAELRQTIRLVSEPGVSRDLPRYHCIRRATSMGLSDLIPATWRPDGRLR